jgi:hypothetical protein
VRCDCPHSVHPYGCDCPNTRSDLTKETARGHGCSRRSSRMASRGERTIREDRLRRNSVAQARPVQEPTRRIRVAVAEILQNRFTHGTFTKLARAIIARRFYTPSIHAVHLRHAIHLWHLSRMKHLARVLVPTRAHLHEKDWLLSVDAHDNRSTESAIIFQYIQVSASIQFGFDP